ncbi:MAG: hypothetical protein ACI9WR_000592, partial [Paracoccaceae bacterium]
MNVPSNPTVSEYFTLSLLDANGNSLGRYQTGKDRTASFGISAVGTYSLKMSYASSGLSPFHDSGEYTLTASLAAGQANGFESESNHSIASADDITLGAAIKAQLSTRDDQDYFKLTATSSGILSVAMDVPTDSSLYEYFTLGLFDAAGNNLGQYQTGKDRTVNFGVATSGTYYLKMSDVSSRFSTYHDSGEYSLTASIAAGSAQGFESESNNSIASADDITLDTAIKAQLATKDDQDYFRLAATAAGILSVVMDVPTN